jgi:sec-independent protein translocase protein TatA
MFGLGAPELMVIAVIALILFGPKKLPEMGKSLGSALREFKKGADSLTQEVKDTVDIDGITKEVSELNKDLSDTASNLSNPLADNKEAKVADKPAKAESEPAKPAEKEFIKS